MRRPVHKFDRLQPIRQRPRYRRLITPQIGTITPRQIEISTRDGTRNGGTGPAAEGNLAYIGRFGSAVIFFEFDEEVRIDEARSGGNANVLLRDRFRM